MTWYTVNYALKSTPKPVLSQSVCESVLRFSHVPHHLMVNNQQKLCSKDATCCRNEGISPPPTAGKGFADNH